MKDVSDLIEAISVMHECEPSYEGSKLVREVFKGQTAWQGEVEIFKLKGHSKAKRCYAWYYTDESEEKQFTTVLEMPPVDSPETAVKIAIASQA